ncbi:hypothetical protein ANCCAN_17501 [Ancylostoma caninum]|uniref:Uncharacterized protein n=1 Tax=Ancylostoma caninum TaxID=29170 RepID=A0A368G0V1_ANCCA|nr:hypothetical protein ANCCAN_17501 [Ancylostoma caninum]
MYPSRLIFLATILLLSTFTIETAAQLLLGGLGGMGAMYGAGFGGGLTNCAYGGFGMGYMGMYGGVGCGLGYGGFIGK